MPIETSRAVFIPFSLKDQYLIYHRIFSTVKRCSGRQSSSQLVSSANAQCNQLSLTCIRIKHVCNLMKNIATSNLLIRICASALAATLIHYIYLYQSQKTLSVYILIQRCIQAFWDRFQVIVISRCAVLQEMPLHEKLHECFGKHIIYINNSDIRTCIPLLDRQYTYTWTNGLFREDHPQIHPPFLAMKEACEILVQSLCTDSQLIVIILQHYYMHQ